MPHSQYQRLPPCSYDKDTPTIARSTAIILPSNLGTFMDDAPYCTFFSALHYISGQWLAILLQLQAHCLTSRKQTNYT